MASELRTYRHRVTGLVSEEESGIAEVFKNVLEPVEPGTKPLAYVPIDADAVAAELVTNADADEPEAEPAAPKKVK